MWIKASNGVKVSMFQLIGIDGTPVETFSEYAGMLETLTDCRLLEMYRWMTVARIFDERALQLQRQGRLGTYAPFSGQEAAQVGSAFALDSQDWVFPTYRDLPVTWVRGLPMERSLLYTMGAVDGGFVPEGVNSFPVQIIIAAQTLHAMGSAWASMYRGDSAVSVAYLGDGATSQGDFHEALNFASVYHLPAVFFVENNQWAISVPRSRQTGSRTLAQKALAYDIPGIQVDGNDVLAVYAATRSAVAKARTGEGPVLMEAVTYRQGPHTTSDDPTRYRSDSEVAKWSEADPISRFYGYLNRRGLMDEEKNQFVRQAAAEAVEQAVTAAEAAPKGGLPEVFETLYQALPQGLRRQRDGALAFLAAKVK